MRKILLLVLIVFFNSCCYKPSVYRVKHDGENLTIKVVNDSTLSIHGHKRVFKGDIKDQIKLIKSIGDHAYLRGETK